MGNKIFVNNFETRILSLLSYYLYDISFQNALSSKINIAYFLIIHKLNCR